MLHNTHFISVIPYLFTTNVRIEPGKIESQKVYDFSLLMIIRAEVKSERVVFKIRAFIDFLTLMIYNYAT